MSLPDQAKKKTVAFSDIGIMSPLGLIYIWHRFFFFYLAFIFNIERVNSLQCTTGDELPSVDAPYGGNLRRLGIEEVNLPM